MNKCKICQESEDLHNCFLCGGQKNSTWFCPDHRITLEHVQNQSVEYACHKCGIKKIQGGFWKQVK